MLAVCGDDAINGKCEHSVAQQLSTMPSWLYVDGADPATLLVLKHKGKHR